MSPKYEPQDRRSQADIAVDAASPEHAVALMVPYLTEARIDKIERVLRGRTLDLMVAVEAPSDPHNAAAIVRTAEALGVMSVHVVAAEGRALHRQSTTQGAYRWVDTQHHARLEDLVTTVKKRGLRLCGAAMDGSTPLSRMDVDAPLCLLLGNEQRGLSDAARAACDALFHVPMVGMSESLNLSVTAAIAMHSVLSRRSPRALPPESLAAWRARYYARSLDARLVLGLLASKEAAL
ncbi:MAG: RNA methyltransferase [Nannocystaceae bacterium]|nr:RNA methyltransferase [Nannocystaceae bacterium]